MITMRKIFPIVFVLLLCSCNKNKSSFKTFELSYYSGWAQSFSIKIDSAGNCFFKDLIISNFDCNKAQAPDSIMNICEELTKEVQNNKYKSFKSSGCADCSSLSILITAKGKKHKLTQMDFTDKKIYQYVDVLQKFINKTKFQKIDSIVIFKSKPLEQIKWITPE